MTSRFPYPLEKGDKLRLFHHMKELSKEHEIILCALTEFDIKAEDLQEVEKYCESVHLFRLRKSRIYFNLLSSLFTGKPLQVAYFHDPRIIQKIKKLVAEKSPDHVYAQLIRTAEYVKEIPLPKTIDYMDAFSVIAKRWSTKSFILTRPLWRFESKRLGIYERSIYPKFNNHLIISDQDRDLMDLGEGNTLNVVPNGVDFEFFVPRPNAEKKYDVAFVGNMGYTPNVEAVKVLVRKILPLLKAKRQNIKILVSGARPTQEIRSLANEHVEVTGWVEDIRDSYSSARVLAIPLFLGAGMQNKILEGMCMKVPCVTTPMVNKAIGAEPGKEILIADTEAGFADCILDLLENEQKRIDIRESASKFVKENLSWSSIVKEFKEYAESYGSEIEHN